MIDNIFLATKLVLVFVGVLLVYSSSKGKTKRFAPGIMLLLLAFFMTGAEMVTSAEATWFYMIYSGSEQDWSKAFFGGVMMMMLPVLLMTIAWGEIDSRKRL